ncbi:TRAP dicarboxylate transporter subunit DctP [Limnochorda pilosa]|uniref:TRAP dicarboxylate transporter subunit DctP n=2 Tax=Limnochorda pilosa TaxID=1555112 RepID=A0A0K2SGE7_LIMPI|nr:TRAP dicarboxylate transporter subunit DctP [Limnochorda pilosa]
MQLTCLAVVLALVATGLTSPAVAQSLKPEYKLSVVPGPNTAWGMGAQRFADLVRERTGGRVNIKVYYSGQLFAGQQTNEFLLLRRGVADFTLSSTINWSPQVPQLNLFSLPFFFADYTEVDAVTSGEAGRRIEELLGKLGVRVLGWGENGYRELSNSVRPVARPEDLRGLKVRAVGSPIFIDTFQALGANPVAMNWSEAVTAFQQGIVDGQENPVTGIYIPHRLWEVHPNLTIWHYTLDPLLLTVNERVWQGLPEDLRQVIAQAAVDAMVYEKAVARAGLDDGAALATLAELGEQVEVTDPLGFLEGQGVQVISPTSEAMEAFRKATEPVRAKWRATIGEDLVTAAEADKASAR